MSEGQIPLAVKVDNGSAKFFDARKGSILHVFGAGAAVSANVSGTYVMVTMKNGSVHVYDGVRGAFLRVL